ncbi:hypothetical protein PBAC_00360 [Pedobacter glucosidilyticus]|nr:hypothetical protein [Pedobacter glucosidilyticus]KHJ39528.1 hypothetical protein PBAC_00360 [Pedobacter glucosidilyticus]
MSKRENQLKMIANLVDYYRKMSDNQLLNISHGRSFNSDIKYKKALNIVLKELGLKNVD